MYIYILYIDTQRHIRKKSVDEPVSFIAGAMRQPNKEDEPKHQLTKHFRDGTGT